MAELTRDVMKQKCMEFALKLFELQHPEGTTDNLEEVNKKIVEVAKYIGKNIWNIEFR